MKISLLLLAFVALIASAAAEPVRYRIYCIDPRGLSFTNRSLPTFYSSNRADIIGVREVTLDESARLEKMLAAELSPSTEVPFCGHMPGHVLEIVEGKNAGGMVTLCGTCRTWANKTGLFVLSGSEALSYLDELLPLPDVFRKLPDGKIYLMDKSKPFYSVKAPE